MGEGIIGLVKQSAVHQSFNAVPDASTDRPAHGGNLEWAAGVAGCSPDEILDFSASINPLGPPSSAIAAIQEHLNDLRAYPDPNYRRLRQVLATHHAKDAPWIDPAWICPGNGSAELLTWASRELSHCPATVLPTPAFGDYGRSLQAFGARILSTPIVLENRIEGLGSLESLEIKGVGELERRDGSLGIVINNPHNPTGHLWRRQEILPLLDQYGLVVVDEAFMDFLQPDQQESVLDAVVDHPNLVVLRSLTKFYSMPGLRIGYAITHPDRIHQWQQWRDPWPVNTLAIEAAIASLADTTFQQQTLNWLDTAKPLLFKGLKSMEGFQPYPGAANYLLVKTSSSAVDLQRRLLQRDRILIRDCVSFSELGDRFFRVAVRTIEENNRLLAALEELRV